MSLFVASAITAGYGAIPVLFDVSIAIEAGQSAALLGRNGVGKTTFLRTAMGYGTDLISGSVTFDGKDLSGASTYACAIAGLHFIPEDRGISGSLTVQDNLELAHRVSRVAKNEPLVSKDELLTEFPIIAERTNSPAGVLSGGERQILAICRAILSAPKMMLIDELAEGVQSVTVQAIARVLRQFTDAGGSVLFVEQNSELAVQVSDVVFVMEKGSIVDQAPARDFEKDSARLQRRLAI